MADHNATDSVSRRTVLTTAGGLLAGTTLFAGQVVSDESKPLNVGIEEVAERIIAARVRMSEELYEHVHERGTLSDRVFLGPADRFSIHGDEETMSLPEDTDGLATPVKVIQSNPSYVLYFRTEDIDFSQVDEGKVAMGLIIVGPDYSWATDTVRFSPGDGVKPT